MTAVLRSCTHFPGHYNVIPSFFPSCVLPLTRHLRHAPSSTCITILARLRHRFPAPGGRPLRNGEYFFQKEICSRVCLCQLVTWTLCQRLCECVLCVLTLCLDRGVLCRWMFTWILIGSSTGWTLSVARAPVCAERH
jgi:hypothetical protein